MIIDNIKNAAKQYGFDLRMEKVFQFLSSLTEQTEPGRYELGDGVFVNVSRAETKKLSDCGYEVHRKYADVQYLIEGGEKIDVCDSEKLSYTKNCLDTDDYAFLENTDACSTAYLEKGDFAILLPGEAHRPMVAIGDEPKTELKAVAKIPMN